jgi:hypothetical protein
MDDITRVLLVYNILRRLLYAESSPGESGEDEYKVSKLGCGGLAVDGVARHLGGLISS